MTSTFRPGFINHLMVYTLVGLGLSGSVGLGTVWVQHQISMEATRDKDLEERIAADQRKSEELTAEIAREQDPDVLLRRNAQWNLGLAPPTEQQIQPVNQDPVGLLMAKNNRELFRANSGSAVPRFKLD